MVYPLKFSPIFKEKIWGGNKLNTFLNKEICSSKTGESWEISSVKGNISVVSEGHMSGMNLKEICGQYKEDLVGRKIFSEFGTSFPLLIKFIDASDDLSVQVHPDNKTAMKRYGENGKTEMWYVVQADEGSKLISGIGKKTSIIEYEKKLKDNKITDLLNYENVSDGNAFFIPAGRIHAIGAGILLAEIQQTSDVTYRIHDWNRPGIDGKLRELHNEQALDVIDFKKYENYRSSYDKTMNSSSQVSSCEFFTVNFRSFDRQFDVNYSSLDSFVIYMCIEGTLLINCVTGSYTLSKGETILLPASIKKYSIEGVASILEIYI